MPRAQTVDCVFLPTNLFDPDIPTDIGRHHVADWSLGRRHLPGLCPTVSAAERVLGQERQGRVHRREPVLHCQPNLQRHHGFRSPRAAAADYSEAKQVVAR